MRDRRRQRENKKLKLLNEKKPWLNSEGYYDPTAYHAIRSIMKPAKHGERQDIRAAALQIT